MQNKFSTHPAVSQTNMFYTFRCQNFGCGNYVARGWSTCNRQCAWQRANDLQRLKKVLVGITEWNHPFWGVKDWTVEKINHYIKQV